MTYHVVTTKPPGETPSRRFALSLPGALRRVKPDVIHAAAVPKHVVAAKAASKLARAPLVVDWYEAPLAGVGTASKSLRMAARAPDEVITPSETVKTRVRELGASGDDVRVIPNNIDMDAIREAQVVDGADIVYLRRPDENANLESLLLALAELRDKGWHTVVIGDDPARDQYERQAADLRIDDRVTASRKAHPRVSRRERLRPDGKRSRLTSSVRWPAGVLASWNITSNRARTNWSNTRNARSGRRANRNSPTHFGRRPTCRR